MERELINRERDLQRQEEDNRIFKAKYNRRYKDINVQGRGPKYLWTEKLEEVDKGDKNFIETKIWEFGASK